MAETTVPVTIVRPKFSTATLVGKILGSLALLAFRAWIVMVLIPEFWKPLSYWQAFALAALVPMLLGQRSEMYNMATREQR